MINPPIDPLPGIHQIPDPRDAYLVHYPLPEILFLVVAAGRNCDLAVACCRKDDGRD